MRRHEMRKEWENEEEQVKILQVSCLTVGCPVQSENNIKKIINI